MRLGAFWSGKGQEREPCAEAGSGRLGPTRDKPLGIRFLKNYYCYYYYIILVRLPGFWQQMCKKESARRVRGVVGETQPGGRDPESGEKWGRGREGIRCSSREVQSRAGSPEWLDYIGKASLAPRPKNLG